MKAEEGSNHGIFPNGIATDERVDRVDDAPMKELSERGDDDDVRAGVPAVSSNDADKSPVLNVNNKFAIPDDTS